MPAGYLWNVRGWRCACGVRLAQQLPAAQRAGLDEMMAEPCITATWSFAPAVLPTMPEAGPGGHVAGWPDAAAAASGIRLPGVLRLANLSAIFRFSSRKR